MAGPTDLLGDGAKRLPIEDEFGLRFFAETLATVVRSRVSADGYVIGIEGEWGSGKTTVLNFLEHELKSRRPSYHRVIRFEPWLFGKRQELLGLFFKELSRAAWDLTSIPEILDKLASRPTLIKDVISKINEYALLLSVSMNVFNATAAIDPTPFSKIVTTLGNLLEVLKKSWTKPIPSLEQVKTQILGDLHLLGNLLPDVRFTVLIDDTDRLDPEDSVEILRLVKAVANFPLVTYVIAFDRKILSAQVVKVISVGTGEDYVEKIFQQLVPLPPQEPFALRRFVRAKLAQYFPEEMVPPSPADTDRVDRYDGLFDRWLGVLLKTPRHAIRLCEAVKFGWPYLQGKADFLDFVWLQSVKLNVPALYKWTEAYVANLVSVR